MVQDQPSYQVYATLLDDEQEYLCGIHTMYRILHENEAVHERRNQLRHPAYHYKNGCDFRKTGI